MKAVNVGYGNAVAVSKITAVISSESAPVTRLIQNAKDNNLAISATNGKKCRSVVFTDGDRIILSAIKPDTLARRIWGTIREDEDDEI